MIALAIIFCIFSVAVCLAACKISGDISRAEEMRRDWGEWGKEREMGDLLKAEEREYREDK